MLLTNSNTAFLALLVMRDHKHKIKSLNLNNTKTSGQLGNKGKMGKGTWGRRENKTRDTKHGHSEF